MIVVNRVDILSSKLSDEYVITVDPLTAEHTTRGLIDTDKTKINILLGMWDEYDSKFHRTLFHKFDFIFNQYITEDEENSFDNLFSLPLGYNGNIIEETEHIQAILPIDERPVDVFFSGHMSSKNRYASMINNITYFKNNPRRKQYNFDFNITGGFMLGFKGKDYYSKLYNSKIVFCPPGNISNETYRFYESMMCGCVIVGPTIPNTNIYKNIEVIQVDDFANKGAETVLDLLEDTKKMRLLQKKSIDYWKQHLSHDAVADYILSKVLVKL